MKKVLVIGGGPAGCSAVHQLYSTEKYNITLVEKSNILGAGLRTNFFGGHPYTFGPRHFLTHKQKVYDYLNNIVPLKDCSHHEFLTYVESDNSFYNFPIHMDDVRSMPDSDLILKEIKEAKGHQAATNLEEFWIGSVGIRLYEKLVKDYNKKMWMIDDNKKIDTFNWSPKGIVINDGPKAALPGYLSAYPIARNGYDDYFDQVYKKCKVCKNIKDLKFDIKNKKVFFNNENHQFDIIINTISPDILFNQHYGELKFIGRDFHKIVFPTEYVFPKNVFFLYYANDEKFTRLVEYKKFTNHKSPTSLIGMEIPSLDGKHYPLPIKSEQELASKYHNEMPEGVFSIGRAGSYRYLVDFDDCIDQSMELIDILDSSSYDHPVPIKRWREI
tara:strand:- start:1145 stop:2302 length:1158 start_codon:yes stop_codon:yes gene_type:complete